MWCSYPAIAVKITVRDFSTLQSWCRARFGLAVVCSVYHTDVAATVSWIGNVERGAAGLDASESLGDECMTDALASERVRASKAPPS